MNKMSSEYKKLKSEIIKLKNKGLISIWPSEEQKIDWAYGSLTIENKNVTRDMVKRIIKEIKE